MFKMKASGGVYALISEKSTKWSCLLLTTHNTILFGWNLKVEMMPAICTTMKNEYLCNEVSINSCDIQQNRNNVDKVVNNYGDRLLTLCKTLEVFIVNGRLGEDANWEKLTCNTDSLVDYFICSALIFPTVLFGLIHAWKPYNIYIAPAAQGLKTSYPFNRRSRLYSVFHFFYYLHFKYHLSSMLKIKRLTSISRIWK